MRHLIAIAIACACAVGACAQPDTVESLCQRAAECNDLSAGTSEQDCVDAFHQCTDKLTTSERDDWEREINDCLSNDSCQLFGSCYSQVPWC